MPKECKHFLVLINYQQLTFRDQPQAKECTTNKFILKLSQVPLLDKHSATKSSLRIWHSRKNRQACNKAAHIQVNRMIVSILNDR